MSKRRNRTTGQPKPSKHQDLMVPIEAAQLYNLGMTTGAKWGEALYEITMAHRDLCELIGNVALMVIVSQTWPADLAAEMLKRSLEASQIQDTWRHEIITAMDDFDRTIKECRPIIERQVPGEIDWTQGNETREVAKDFADALGFMFPETDMGASDNGAALRQCVVDWGGPDIHQVLHALTTNMIILKIGRPTDPLNDRLRYRIEQIKPQFTSKNGRVAWTKLHHKLIDDLRKERQARTITDLDASILKELVAIDTTYGRAKRLSSLYD